MAYKTTIGFNAGKGQIRLTRSKISKSMYKTARNELKYIQEEMRRKVDKFEFEGVLSKSIRIMTKNVTEDSINISISTKAAHAKLMEYGTHPRFIYRQGKPNLDKWMDEHKNKDWEGSKYQKHGLRQELIQIGGKGSHIKWGKSRNKFFYNTIDEYIRNNPRKRLVTEIKKGLKNK